jgi:DNA invertase Pin-like site-specific DNA recombinase
MATIKAFGYVRVSGKDQVNGDGFTRQEQAIRKYAKAHKITLADVYKDTISGTKELANREGLAALWARLDANGVRMVLVEKMDRVARDQYIGEGILREFAKRGVAVIECESGNDLTTGGDPTRKFIRQVLGAVAELDKTFIVNKLKAARDRKRDETGRCEGRKPYGTRPGEAPVIDRIKALRSDGKSLREVAAILDAENAPTRTGAHWSAMAVKNISDRLPEQVA